MIQVMWLLVIITQATSEGSNYPAHQHSLYIKGENWQKLLQQLYANHMHILISWRKHTQSFKSVRGVALTTNTHCLYIQGEKWLSLQCLKSDKNWSNNYVQSTCTSSYHEENTCKVSKQLVQNCKRSCAHNKYPLSIYSGWKWLSWQCRKSDKIYPTTMSNPPAHPHTMRKTHAKFQNNGCKTVRGVALTRYPC